MPQNRSSAEQALNHPFVTRAYKQEAVPGICVPDPTYISPKGEIIPSMVIAPAPLNIPVHDMAYLTSVNMSAMNEGCTLRNLTPDDLGTTFDDIDTEELQKGGLIPRFDSGTTRAPKKTANRPKNNNITDLDKIEKKENAVRAKITYVQEDILAADSSAVSLPCSAWTDTGTDCQADVLKCDNISLPQLSTSIPVPLQAQVQIAVTSNATATSPSTGAVCFASYGGVSDTLHIHHQNIPLAGEHSVTNIKTRESKRKLSAVQQSTSTNEAATLPNKRNCKKKVNDDRGKEKGKEGERVKSTISKEVKEVVTTATSIAEKGTHSKAKMRLGDNFAAATATSLLDATKNASISVPNKRNGASKYTEVTGEKGAGEKGRGGRGERGGSRDFITEMEINAKTELDVKRGLASAAPAGVGVSDTRRCSKRDRSDTRHLQQQQQRQQQQQQMIVCGGEIESSFLSQEDSNTTVETASQGSCDW